ncbi:MAG: DUF1080 domain-containing protein [Planctomycetes bacterium]|nr:DUF1080 domain-containing protein [Planctomycetota bacterium]
MSRAWLLAALSALVSGGEAEFKPGEGWVPLFNGKDLAGWKGVGRYKSEWRAEGGVLANPAESDNLYTEKEFADFQLHLEFKLPKGGNSGVFLRGCKEVQLLDSFGKAKLADDDCGGIFGKLPPAVNACKPPGEWNALDVTIVGRKITVVLNGKTTVDGQVVNGVTGGQINEEEDKPGPLMLQGDHSAVWFRNLWIKPLAGEAGKSAK